MAKVRLVRGDLGWFPADVYLISAHEKGAPFRYGAARNLVDALEERLSEGGRPENLLEHVSRSLETANARGGEAHLLPRPPGASERVPELITLACVPSRGGDASPLVQKALERGLELGTRGRPEPVTLAMHAVGSGGARLRFWEAATASARAIKAWLASPHAGDHELVVVIWQAHAYCTYLRVLKRHGLLEPTLEECLELGPEDEELIPRLRECLTSRESILFVGSGLSYNAVPGKPTWRKLFEDEWLPPRARRGADPGPVPLDYPKIAQMVVDQVGSEALERYFLERIAMRSLPALSHLQLLSLPWAAILTTNYDDLVERTLRLLRLPYTLITHDDQIANLDSARGIPVVKLHGGFCEPDCEHPDPHHEVDGRLGTRLIATQDDYDAFFDERPAMAAFLESRLLTSRGLIIGYSITDPHLQRLFARIGGVTPRKSNPRLFCLSDTRGEADAYWRHRGVVPAVMRDLRDGEGYGDRYRDIIDALVTDAELALEERSVPNNLLGPKAWARFLDNQVIKRSPEKIAAVITALVDAGAGPPPPRVLEKLPGSERLRALADQHLSPARRAHLDFLWGEEVEEPEEDEEP